MDFIDEMKKNQNKMKKQIETLLQAMDLTAKEGTYDKKCSKKFADRFSKIQYSYGALLSFAQYVKGCSKYFTCENCKSLANIICDSLRKFIGTYEEVLY